MKIILLQNDNKLGRKGDVKDVSDGFARNFLIPQHIAVVYSERMEKTVLSSTAKKQKAKINPKSLMGKLKSLTLVFEEKADENGTFFAGITADKIAKELLSRGIDVKSKQVNLDHPIKTAGEVKVNVTVDNELKSEIKIITKVKA
jgi:large subunit ribosomal protein L9